MGYVDGREQRRREGDRGMIGGEHPDRRMVGAPVDGGDHRSRAPGGGRIETELRPGVLDQRDELLG